MFSALILDVGVQKTLFIYLSENAKFSTHIIRIHTKTAIQIRGKYAIIIIKRNYHLQCGKNMFINKRI